MLMKLIGFELRKASKSMGIMWAAAIALAVVSGISYHANQIAGILIYLLSTLLFIILFVVLMLVVIAHIVIHFYQDMLTTKGYLTHMLPVQPWQHIVARVLTALIWFALSVLILFGSIGLMYLISGVGFGSFRQNLLEGTGLAGVTITAGDIFLHAAYALSGIFAGILAVYTAILLGGCANRHRGLFAFLALVGIAAAETILASFLGVGETVSLVDTSGAFSGYVTVATWKETVYQIILMVIFFCSSRDLLEKRINLV